jgi:hypothetical protein
MVADKFLWVFSESLLNACGTDAKFCRRMRTITPFRLGLALTATCASQRVETLADFHRGFNAVFDTTITYKAFYNQLAKARFATFMGTMASRLIGEMTLKVLGFARDGPLQNFAISLFRMAAPLLSTTPCARCFPDASKWSNPPPSNSIPPWTCCVMPRRPSS